MDLDSLRVDLENFELELSSEHLQHLVGLKEDINSVPIYEKYPSLFSLKNVKALRKIVDSSTGLDRRRNIFLLGGIVGGFMSEPLKELSDERDTFEAKATVDVDGKPVPLRQIGILLSNEPDHKKRKRLFKLTLPVKRKLEKYDKRMLKSEWRLAKRAGFPDYTSLFAFLKDCDYDSLAADMRRFLVRTDALFQKLIERAMSSIKVPMSDAYGFDVSFWIRNPSFDKCFPKEGLVSSLKDTLKGLGLDLDSQSNIKLDVEDRPKKVPRAFCMPLRIPDEVHLVIKPSGGQNDYKSLFHECGHSEHYANSSADLPFEFKHMGSHCVSETYAFTFEHFIMSKSWLKAHTTMDDKAADEFLFFDMSVKLFFLRRYAAKLLYELKLHRQDLALLDDSFEPVKGQAYKSMAACYADMLTKASKVKIHPLNWASDVDGGYYSADYLRAWILEAQLKSHMVKTLGPDWIHKSAAGDFLKGLWKDANKPMPLELAQAFGFSSISMDILSAEVTGFFDGKI